MPICILRPPDSTIKLSSHRDADQLSMWIVILLEGLFIQLEQELAPPNINMNYYST